LAATAFAQYGHPLKGTWSGDWGTSAKSRNRVLLDLDWNGKAITGRLNPGQPTEVTIKQVTAEPVVPAYDAWTVRIQGETKDASGATVPVVIEGKVVNLGAYNRTMSGTWIQSGMKGDFNLTRN
jgi:hypothetical protein